MLLSLKILILGITKAKEKYNINQFSYLFSCFHQTFIKITEKNRAIPRGPFCSPDSDPLEVYSTRTIHRLPFKNPCLQSFLNHVHILKYIR